MYGIYDIILRIVASFRPIGLAEDDSAIYHHLFVYLENKEDAEKLSSVLEEFVPSKVRIKENEGSGSYPPGTQAIVVIHIR